jgi:hypothetical protein
MRYLFLPAMSRFDALLAWVISGMYASGRLTGWETVGCVVVGLLASAVGEIATRNE